MPEFSVGRPEGVVVLRDGRIAVSDTHYQRIVIFSPDGKLDRMFGRKGQGRCEFIYPVAITEMPDGRLAVAEYGGNDRVQLLKPTGEYTEEFGTFGTGPDQLQRPSGIKVWQDRFFVADAMNNRVQIFDAQGIWAGALALPGLYFPYDLHRHPAGAWCVVEYGAGRVSWLDDATGAVRRFGRSGRGSGEFLTPWGLAVTPAGHILVADTGNKRIVELLV
jgi:DNA-binding beta-propeller fold protein YncE